MRRVLSILLLLSLPTWAAVPTYIEAGASVVNAGTGVCFPSMPASTQANDILLMVACGEGDNVGGSIALSTANGFVEYTGGDQSGDDGDAAEEDPENDCSFFWKRAVGGDAQPSIADTGNNTSCAVFLFRGVRTTGDPFDVVGAGNDSNANDQSAVIPGATTTSDDNLIVLVQGTSNNATGTANCGAVTNADLTNINERFDSSNTSGLGSGFCLITGEKASTGTYTDSTLTMGATTYKAAFSIALVPAAPGTAVCGPNMLLGMGCR